MSVVDLEAPARRRLFDGFLTRHGRLLGTAGVVVLAVWYAVFPSHPTADKVGLMMLFLAMALGATEQFLVRFLPFFVTMFVYESFRGLADDLNTRVEYDLLIDADRWIGGGVLPTERLQDWLWDGQAGFLEIGLYVVYMMHFVLPFGLAFLLWRRRPHLYWTYASSIIITSFAAFATFVAFPAAPPWLARAQGRIDGIDHVSASVWGQLGLRDVPTLYDQISPNPVAAMPSLHAAYATLFAMFVWKAFGPRWGTLAVVYPTLIYFGTVYLGEHYLIDEFAGSLLAVVCMVAARALVTRARAIREARTSREHPVPEAAATRS